MANFHDYSSSRFLCVSKKRKIKIIDVLRQLVLRHVFVLEKNIRFGCFCDIVVIEDGPKSKSVGFGHMLTKVLIEVNLIDAHHSTLFAIN
jgi:hypothetical protein